MTEVAHHELHSSAGVATLLPTHTCVSANLGDRGGQAPQLGLLVSHPSLGTMQSHEIAESHNEILR